MSCLVLQRRLCRSITVWPMTDANQWITSHKISRKNWGNFPCISTCSCPTFRYVFRTLKHYLIEVYILVKWDFFDWLTINGFSVWKNLSSWSRRYALFTGLENVDHSFGTNSNHTPGVFQWRTIPREILNISINELPPTTHRILNMLSQRNARKHSSKLKESIGIQIPPSLSTLLAELVWLICDFSDDRVDFSRLDTPCE